MGERSDLEFPSGKGSCAAWVYQPGAARSRPGPCVVMAPPQPTVAWILPLAIAHRAGRLNRIQVTGPAGAKAAMALPGEGDGFAAVVPPGSPWRNEITPGVFLTVALHRPVAKAKKVACPLWVGLGEQDISVSGKALQRLAARAPKAELQRYPFDHWQPCVGDAPARIAADQIAFLRRHDLLGA